MTIQHVYRIGDDAFGNRVRFKIFVPEEGVYFRDAADFVVPLKDIGDFNLAG